MVDRDDGRPAAAAETLDRPERDLAVGGGLAGADAELLPRSAPAPAGLRPGRTTRSCRPRPCAGRWERGAACRRRTRPPRRTRASCRAHPRTRATPPATGSRGCSCASRSAGKRRGAPVRILRLDLLHLVVVGAHRSTSPMTVSSEPTIAIMSAIERVAACTSPSPPARRTTGARNLTRHGFGPPSETT